VGKWRRRTTDYRTTDQREGKSEIRNKSKFCESLNEGNRGDRSNSAEARKTRRKNRAKAGGEVQQLVNR
jgi:hypothetical protein